jgi:hypothetical protein
MQKGKWRVLPAVFVASALMALAGGSIAAAPPKVKSCKLLKPAEITDALGAGASEGTQQGADCTWQAGGWAVSLELTTKNAKATFESLRDLATDAGAQPEKITGIRDQAIYAEIPSFKELLILKGKKFLFLRVLDIAEPIDSETAKAALADLGKKAAKRV